MEKQEMGHILVADDHEINQALFKGLLEHAGYEVTLAANGEEVLGVLRTTRFDLVVMDCMMPVMDGFEATRAIRGASGEDFDPDIPILATTALSGEEDRERCLAAGMDDYLSKPVDANVLFGKVQRLLRSVRPIGRTRAENVAKLDSILHSMSDRLRRDLAAWQAELQALEKRGDWHQANELAHKIRGLADLMGDTELSRLAAAVECPPEYPSPLDCRQQIRALALALGRRERRYASQS